MNKVFTEKKYEKKIHSTRHFPEYDSKFLNKKYTGGRYKSKFSF